MVTGVAWPLMFIDAVLPLTVFSFIATFANALQGVFIFFAFICNKKVLGLYKHFCYKRHQYSVAGDSRRKCTPETAMLPEQPYLLIPHTCGSWYRIYVDVVNVRRFKREIASSTTSTTSSHKLEVERGRHFDLFTE